MVRISGERRRNSTHDMQPGIIASLLAHRFYLPFEVD